MYPRILVVSILLMTSMVSCKSLRREKRDASSAVPHHLVQMAAENRQLGGGVFSLGTLVSPLLFMMGMGSFMSMLPQMFQSVMRGVGPNLFQIFNPTVAANSGGSSRMKRSAEAINSDLLEEIERRLDLALNDWD